MKSTNPVVWFEIYVDNLERARKFYETVLALKLEDLPMPGEQDDAMKMIVFPMDMEVEGAAGALIKMDGVKAGGNSTIVYFGINDCSVKGIRIENAGGKIIRSKESIGEYGFMLLANDTEGNTIGIDSEA